MKKIITLLFTIALGAILNTATAEPKFKADQETTSLFIRHCEQSVAISQNHSVTLYQISNFETLSLPLTMQLSKRKVRLASGELVERMKNMDIAMESGFLKLDQSQNTYLFKSVLWAGQLQRFKYNWVNTLREHWLFVNNAESFNELTPFRLIETDHNEIYASWHPVYGFTFDHDNTDLEPYNPNPKGYLDRLNEEKENWELIGFEQNISNLNHG